MKDDTKPSLSPALTRDEWAKKEKWSRIPDGGEGVAVYLRDDLVILDDGDSASVSLPEMRHALAALALHEQPFGFTHDDLRALLNPPTDPRDTVLREAKLRRLAARIAALLPLQP